MRQIANAILTAKQQPTLEQNLLFSLIEITDDYIIIKSVDFITGNVNASHTSKLDRREGSPQIQDFLILYEKVKTISDTSFQHAAPNTGRSRQGCLVL